MQHDDNDREEHIWKAEESPDPVIRVADVVIRQVVRVLAGLMVLVIIWGVLDVGFTLYRRVIAEPFLLLDFNDMLAIFGAFLAVLIAIEIFVNITLYLREDVIHVKLVVATALMAVSRKVIVFDFGELDPDYLWSSAALVLALGLTYWLVRTKLSPPS